MGPDEQDCVTAGELVGLFCEKWESGALWVDHSEVNAPYESNFLKLDCSKLKSVLGWKPRWHVDEAIAMTAAWTRIWQSGGDIPAEMGRQIAEYMEEK